MISVAIILWLVCSYAAYKKLHDCEPNVGVRLTGSAIVGFLYAIAVFSLSVAVIKTLGVLL